MMACEYCAATRMVAMESLNAADTLLMILCREGVAVAEQKLFKKRLEAYYERLSELKADDVS